MKQKYSHNTSNTKIALGSRNFIENRAITLAHYIIDSKDTVRGAAKNLEFQNLQYIKMCQKD